MPDLEFRGAVEQFAARDIHNHHHSSTPEPPTEPRVSLACPQCTRWTWRFSQYCMHCHLDLFAWRSRTRRRRVWHAVRVMISMLGRVAC